MFHLCKEKALVFQCLVLNYNTVVPHSDLLTNTNNVRCSHNDYIWRRWHQLCLIYQQLIKKKKKKKGPDYFVCEQGQRQKAYSSVQLVRSYLCISLKYYHFQLLSDTPRRYNEKKTLKIIIILYFSLGSMGSWVLKE